MISLLTYKQLNKQPSLGHINMPSIRLYQNKIEPVVSALTEQGIRGEANKDLAAI